jgi:glucosamine kinase
MIVVADSGSTKTDWRLIISKTEIIPFSTEGLNPVHVDNYTVVRTLINHFPDHIDPRNVTQVYFYGAGCASEQHQQRMSFCLESFFEEADVFVDTDLAGAAKGVLNDTPGLLAILGSSASACIYDGSTITQKSTSLGYLIGDEGGGVNIGAQIVKGYYYMSMPESLSELFKIELGMTQDELANNLNTSENPIAFLSNFVEFAVVHKDHPYIKQLISESFRKFTNLHLLPLSGKMGIQNVGLVGSVGLLFYEILEKEFNAHNLHIERKLRFPIEGLVEYHLLKI